MNCKTKEFENIKRKIRLRREAYNNMIGEINNGYTQKLSQDEKEKLFEKINNECSQIDEYACYKVYTEVVARNKIIFVVKKIIRKIFFKLLGWYYVPMIEGQIEYNQKIKTLIFDMQRLLDSQQREIQEMQEQLKNSDN